MILEVLTIKLNWTKVKINPINYRHEITEQLNKKFGSFGWLTYKIINEENDDNNKSSKSFSREDLEKAYIEGFTKHCELAKENMYDAHYELMKKEFAKWIKSF